jgi:hypothetical protein
MNRKLLAAVVACGAVGMLGAGAANAEPKGHAYGYWAGRLCDHMGPTTNGTTYWQSRGYATRDACVEIEGASLRAGEWDPATLDPIQYPI